MSFMPPVFREPRRRWRGPAARAPVGDGTLALALGALLGAGLLVFDVMGLRTMLWRADVALAGSILFIGAFALTLGGVVAASAAFRDSRDDDDEPRGGERSPLRALARVAAPRRAR